MYDETIAVLMTHYRHTHDINKRAVDIDVILKAQILSMSQSSVYIHMTAKLKAQLLSINLYCNT